MYIVIKPHVFIKPCFIWYHMDIKMYFINIKSMLKDFDLKKINNMLCDTHEFWIL